MINRFQSGVDGKTVYEGWKTKRHKSIAHRNSNKESSLSRKEANKNMMRKAASKVKNMINR